MVKIGGLKQMFSTVGLGQEYAPQAQIPGALEIAVRFAVGGVDGEGQLIGRNEAFVE